MGIHPVEGVELRLKWVEAEFTDLKNTVKSVEHATGQSRGSVNYDFERGKYIFCTDTGIRMTPEFGVRVGMIVHNLRAALDNIAWALASKSVGGTPYRLTMFPIALRARKGGTPYIPNYPEQKPVPFFFHPLTKKGKRQGPLQDVGRKHRLMIERFQPYKTGNGGRRDPLWLLSELNNADKHRVIQVVKTHFEVNGVKVEPREALNGRIKCYRGTYEKGVKLAEIPCAHDPGLQFEVTFTMTVCFDGGCKEVEGLEVCSTLGKIITKVIDIYETFIPELK